MSFSHATGHDFPTEMPRPANLAALRQRIRHIERPVSHGVLPFGVAAIDRALPGGGLARGAVHEILGVGGDEEDGAAAAGFAAGILARLSATGAVTPPTSPSYQAPQSSWPGLTRPSTKKLVDPRAKPGDDGVRTRGEVGNGGSGSLVLWCLKRPDLYGPGLMAHGLDPARLVIVTVPRDEDILWAVEEGLRVPGLGAVIGEIGRLPLVAGRRLQLAAERFGIPAFPLLSWRHSQGA